MNTKEFDSDYTNRMMYNLDDFLGALGEFKEAYQGFSLDEKVEFAVSVSQMILHNSNKHDLFMLRTARRSDHDKSFKEFTTEDKEIKDKFEKVLKEVYNIVSMDEDGQTVQFMMETNVAFTNPPPLDTLIDRYNTFVSSLGKNGKSLVWKNDKWKEVKVDKNTTKEISKNKKRK